MPCAPGRCCCCLPGACSPLPKPSPSVWTPRAVLVTTATQVWGWQAWVSGLGAWAWDPAAARVTMEVTPAAMTVAETVAGPATLRAAKAHRKEGRRPAVVMEAEAAGPAMRQAARVHRKVPHRAAGTTAVVAAQPVMLRPAKVRHKEHRRAVATAAEAAAQ